VKRREDWFEGQLDLDPERLVFIDETWGSTNMARQCRRAPRGQRLHVSADAKYGARSGTLESAPRGARVAQ
jgi:hypothetical protein